MWSGLSRVYPCSLLLIHSKCEKNIYSGSESRPVVSQPQRGPKPLSRGPITTSFRMRRDRDAEGVERDETRGGVSPHHRLRVWGNAVSFPSGSAPAKNGFFAYLRSEKNRLELHFQYFWAMAAPPPQTSRGPGKLPPSPLSTSLSESRQ